MSAKFRIAKAIGAGALLLAGGCTPPEPYNPSDQPPPTPASSDYPLPADSPDPDQGGLTAVEIKVRAACEGAVTAASHLSPDILSFTDEKITKLSKRLYTMDGYVNDIDFACTNIRIKGLDVNYEIPIDVEIGGVDMNDDY
jgi:hypothetical protein